MTPEEKHLWYDFLKRLPYNVRRQHNIENYIVDFYIAKKKIVIEVDGIQHTSPEHKKTDAQRDASLAAWGLLFCDIQMTAYGIILMRLRQIF